VDMYQVACNLLQTPNSCCRPHEGQNPWKLNRSEDNAARLPFSELLNLTVTSPAVNNTINPRG